MNVYLIGWWLFIILLIILIVYEFLDRRESAKSEETEYQYIDPKSVKFDEVEVRQIPTLSTVISKGGAELAQVEKLIPVNNAPIFEVENNDAICPYCNLILAKKPQRKTKCKGCGNYIYCKSTPDNRTRRLMTESQASEAEKLWQAKYSTNIARDFGINETVNSKESLYELCKQRANDFTLSAHQRLMAAFVLKKQKFETEQQRLNVEHQIQRNYLINMAENSPKMYWQEVQIRAGLGACESCLKLHTKRYNFSDAVNTDPLPNVDCERWVNGGPCCAMWSVVIPSVDN